MAITSTPLHSTPSTSLVTLKPTKNAHTLLYRSPHPSFPNFFFAPSQKTNSHPAKTPIISAIASSAAVLIIWTIVLLGWLWKQYKKRVRAKRRAARGLPPKVKKPKKPLPTFILPPDPAVITGQREPGERAIPRKHGSMDKNVAPTANSIELNERSNNRTPNEHQIHDEMIARQVFSKRSSLDPPKHEKRHHPSRCRYSYFAGFVTLLTLVCQRKLVSRMTEPDSNRFFIYLKRFKYLYPSYNISLSCVLASGLICTPY